MQNSLPTVKEARKSAISNSKLAIQNMKKGLRIFADQHLTLCGPDASNRLKLLSAGKPVWLDESLETFWRKAPKRLDDFFYFGRRILHAYFAPDVDDVSFVNAVEKAWKFINESIGIKPEVPVLSLFDNTIIHQSIIDEMFDKFWRLSVKVLLAYEAVFVLRMTEGDDKNALKGAKLFYKSWAKEHFPEFSDDYSWLGYTSKIEQWQPDWDGNDEGSVKEYQMPMGAYFPLYEKYLCKLVRRGLDSGDYTPPLFTPYCILHPVDESTEPSCVLTVFQDAGVI